MFFAIKQKNYVDKFNIKLRRDIKMKKYLSSKDE